MTESDIYKKSTVYANLWRFCKKLHTDICLTADNVKELSYTTVSTLNVPMQPLWKKFIGNTILL